MYCSDHIKKIISSTGKFLFVIFILFLGLYSQEAFAQKKKKNKPNPVLILADKHFNNHEYYLAGQEYGRVLRHDSSNAYAMYQMAECYRMYFDYKNAERFYRKVAERFRTTYPFARFWYATMLKDNAHFEKAIEQFNKYREEHTDTDLETELYREKAIQEIKGCEEAMEDDKKKVEGKDLYKFRCLPKPVNSPEGEYAPVVFENDSFLLVTSARKGSVGGGKDNSFGGALSDVYRFRKEADSVWTTIHHSHNDEFHRLNTAFNESSGSITGDRKKFYFTRCDEIVRVDNYQEYNCAIYVSQSRNGKWDKAIRLNENINMPGQWNSQPSISPDGNILFFVSKRPGGLGMHDIWYSTCNGDDGWGPPINLGDRINTLFVDMSPRYYSEQKVLFFSSNGHGGRGGLDIFMAREEDGFQNIINLGTPFNSNRDDFYFVLGEKKGYLTSNREGGIGFDDIYTFNIRSKKNIIEGIIDTAKANIEDSLIATTPAPREEVISEITASTNPDHTYMIITGQEKDSTSGKPYPNAEIILRDKQGNEVAKTVTDQDGNYQLNNIPNDKNYVVSVKNPDPGKNTFAKEKPQVKFVEKTIEARQELISKIPKDATPNRTVDIKGMLKDSTSGKPLAGVEVQVVDEVGNVISKTQSNANGEYELKDIPSDRNYKVVVNNTNPGKLKISKPKPTTNYKSTQPALVAKELDLLSIPKDSIHDQIESIHVSGVVKDENGQPVKSGNVIIKDEFGNNVKTLSLVNGKYDGTVPKEGNKGYKVVYSTKALPEAQFTSHEPQVIYKRKTPVKETQAVIATVKPSDAPEGSKSINIEGSIFYDDNGKPAAGATILLVDETGSMVKTAKTDSKGAYKFVNLPADRTYRVILQQGKLNQNDRAYKPGNVEVKGSEQVSSRVLFENIYFDFDKADLRPEATKVLDELADYCKKNPSVQIEMSANTDSYGTPSYNKMLSGKRGNAAQDYLIEKGVPQSSIVVNAQGEGKSIATNDSEFGRQLNRRVEFYILGGKGYETPFMTAIVPPKRTLYSLAKEYNMTVEELRDANGLTGDELKAYAPLRVRRGASDRDVLSPTTRALSRSYVSDESEFTREQREVFKRQKEINARLNTNPEYKKVMDSISNHERINGSKIDAVGIVWYVTQPKNTLYNIAKLYGMKVEDLKTLNGLDSDTIYINQKIKVDLSMRDASIKGYQVKEGDTIGDIAKRFGLTIDELLEINNLDGYILRKNMILRLSKD